MNSRPSSSSPHAAASVWRAGDGLPITFIGEIYTQIQASLESAVL